MKMVIIATRPRFSQIEAGFFDIYPELSTNLLLPDALRRRQRCA